MACPWRLEIDTAAQPIEFSRADDAFISANPRNSWQTVRTRRKRQACPNVCLSNASTLHRITLPTLHAKNK